MAKIYGISNNEGNVRKTLDQMGKTFGFGKIDTYSIKDLGIGHIRIPGPATIDNRRIAYDDKVIVCMAGEIFDYEKDLEYLKQKIPRHNSSLHTNLKDGPEEYILLAYQNYGISLAQKLNGTFVIMIFDIKQKIFYLINDRTGFKPIYYHASEHGITFASEIKAIIADKSIKREINWTFWKDFFSYSYALGNKTPFNNIYSMPNATILKYQDGSLSLEKYWDYDKVRIDYERTEEETVNQGVEVIRNVIKRQTKELNECMILLSGGYDSRCITAAVRRYTNIKIHAYTIAKTDKSLYNASNNMPTISRNPSVYDMDEKYSQMVAEALGIEHHIVSTTRDIYKRYFTGFVKETDALCSEHIWMMPLMQRLSEDISRLEKDGQHGKDTHLINFDGIAADVFLKAGYIMKPEWNVLDDLSNIHRIKNNTNKELSIIIDKKLVNESHFDYRKIISFLNPEVYAEIDKYRDSIYDELRTIWHFDNMIKVFQARNRTKNSIALEPSNIIMRRIYSRMPFCDNEFVDFALSIPMEMKVRKNIYKRILNKSFPEVMHLPTTNDPKNLKEKFKNALVKNKMDFLRYGLGSLGKAARRLRRERMHSISRNPRDVDHLIMLAKTMELPSFINRKSLVDELDRCVRLDEDPTRFLEPLMQFITWHKMFFEHTDENRIDETDAIERTEKQKLQQSSIASSRPKPLLKQPGYSKPGKKQKNSDDLRKIKYSKSINAKKKMPKPKDNKIIISKKVIKKNLKKDLRRRK